MSAKISIGSGNTKFDQKLQITMSLDNAGTVISSGAKSWFRVPLNITLTGWEVTADQSGTIDIDIWQDTFANFPPTDADSICSGNEPGLTAEQTNSSSDLSGWSTTSLVEGSYVRFNVDPGVSGVTLVELVLKGAYV